MKARRGRPPKKIEIKNPSYSRLKIKKVLQDSLMEDPNNYILTESSSQFISSVLTKLENGQ